MSLPLHIDIDPHALYRLSQRALEFGIDLVEAHRRVFETIRSSNHARRKHISKVYATYYRYFADGISFYVICEEISNSEPTTHIVKTVIIEKGRE